MRRAEASIKFLRVATASLALTSIGSALIVNERRVTFPSSAIDKPKSKSQSESTNATTIFSQTIAKPTSETSGNHDSKPTQSIVTTTTKAEPQPTTTKPATTTTTTKTCENSVETPTWNRAETVRRLKAKGVFAAPYYTWPTPSNPEGDLLNSNKSAPELINLVKDLDILSECAGFTYVARIVVSGHDTASTTGGNSDHPYGIAIDISFPSLSAWKLTSEETPPTQNEIIIRNSQATRSANTIMNFLGEHPEKYKSVIWSDAQFVIKNGKKIAIPPRAYWKDNKKLLMFHQDHIHISVNSESSPQAVSQTVSAFKYTHSSESD